MRVRRHFKSVLSAILFCLVPVLAVAEIGRVVEVSQPAAIRADGGEMVRLEVDDQVSMGDSVATGKTGRIQLLFPDDTRIVVGPNSQIKLTNLKFRSDNKARRFRVNAVSGTFRMLTGNSPKRAFRVKTPTASMAVRGTQFDFDVERETRTTTLVVHDGEVRLCATNTRCANVPKGCQLVQLNQLRGFSQPRTEAERREILSRAFPFAQDDSALEPLFRALIESCKDDKKDKKSAEEEKALPTVLKQIDLPPDPGTPSNKSSSEEEPRGRNPAE